MLKNIQDRSFQRCIPLQGGEEIQKRGELLSLQHSRLSLSFIGFPYILLSNGVSIFVMAQVIIVHGGFS